MKSSGSKINSSTRKVSTTKQNSWEPQPNQGSNYRNQFVNENNLREKKQPQSIDPSYPEKKREGFIRDSQSNEEGSTKNIRATTTIGNPYNQLGMGMGMGMNPYMGMPFSPMMGGMMGGPFSFIYSLNYFVSSFAQGISMLSANSFMVYQLFHTVQNALKDLEIAIRRSAFRRWLQRKSRKSAVLRYLFVFSSMVITSQLLRILRHLIEQKLESKPSSQHLMSDS
eukprot:gene22532-30796_t